jgi:cell division septum initiation protein DivIVA
MRHWVKSKRNQFGQTQQIIMTKAQEIDALRGFIKSLPADTYIGPWLSGIVGEVQSLMQSDLPINCSMREAQLAADTIRADAIAEAKRILDKATDEARKLKAIADNQSDAVIGRARQACHEALRSLDR